MHLENVVVNTDTAAKVPITAARAANSHMEHAVAVLHLVQYQAEEAAQGEVLVLDKRRRMILAEARKKYICPSSKCCSKYGYCGKSSDYCGKGCQSAFGQCN